MNLATLAQTLEGCPKGQRRTLVLSLPITPHPPDSEVAPLSWAPYKECKTPDPHQGVHRSPDYTYIKPQHYLSLHCLDGLLPAISPETLEVQTYCFWITQQGTIDRYHQQLFPDQQGATQASRSGSWTSDQHRTFKTCSGWKVTISMSSSASIGHLKVLRIFPEAQVGLGHTRASSINNDSFWALS